MRKLSKLPRRKCWFVGSSKLDAVDVATKFNSDWRTDLRVGHHDCRDYTNGNNESHLFIYLFYENPFPVLSYYVIWILGNYS